MSDVQLLTSEQAFERLQQSVPQKVKHANLSLYSSLLGGITTDPTFMVVPLDDHIVHRGHAVFDTANVVNGKVYGLKFHVERLFNSAKQARIEHDLTYEKVREIVLQTVAASGERDKVFVRMWLSVGRGDFNVTPYGCTGASFFVVCHRKDFRFDASKGGLRERIVDVPLKPRFLATMKSTNYLVNAVCAMEGQNKDGDLGLQLDENGNVAEMAIGSCAFLGKDGILRTPKLERLLRSTTLIRAYELSPKLVEQGLIKEMVFEDVSVEMAKDSVEMLGFGGGLLTSVVSLDDQPIGNGSIGQLYYALDKLLKDDMANNAEFLDDIPELSK